jgi:alpha-L-fucosidase
MKLKTLLFILLPLVSFHYCRAQEETGLYVPEADSLVLQKLGHWQDLKFGLLMHWGPYSQWGVVESWSICSEDEDWCRRKSDNYVQYKQQYENLKTTFNPVHFDPARWAAAARDAGMRYVIFTTKHHDGFCMFDTKYTAYKVTDTGCPFHSDARANITKEIFDVFRQQGFMVGAYFSKPDWHNGYYWWPNFATPDRNVNYDIKKYPDRWEKFTTFTHNQIDELMSDYGRIDILWLDGGWVRPLSKEEIIREINSPDYRGGFIQSQDIRMDEIVKAARLKQPGLIVVDRAVPGKNQNYLTPENEVPDHMLFYPWESCIISGGGWSWVKDATYMSPNKLVHLLVDIVAKGGNLLLNIAPGPDGSWDRGAYDMLEAMGQWIKVNGEAIYGTRPQPPFKEGKICLTAKKDGTVYAIYLADEDEKEMPAMIGMTEYCPEEDAVITLLDTETPLLWSKVGKGFMARVPEALQKNPPCQEAWVFKITKQPQ